MCQARRQTGDGGCLRGDEEAEGLAISRELAAELRPLVQGIQVAAPSGRIDLALAILGDVMP